MGYFPAPFPVVTLVQADSGSTPISRIDMGEYLYCLKDFKPAWVARLHIVSMAITHSGLGLISASLLDFF